MTFWLLEQRRREDVSQASSVCEVYYTMEARWGVASWLDKWPFQSVNLCYPHKLFQGKAGARKTTCHLIHKALAGWCWHLTWTNHLWCMRKIWMRCEKDVPRKTLCHFLSLWPPNLLCSYSNLYHPTCLRLFDLLVWMYNLPVPTAPVLWSLGWGVRFTND